MKRFMATTAAALVLSTGAYADTTMNQFDEVTFDAEKNLNASEFIGMRVYASEADIAGTIPEGGETEWDDIGEINELVLTRDGNVQNVIVGVGGFLGMGEKDVAMSMDQIKFVAEEGDSGEFFLVVNANAAGVEEAPAYERTSMTGGWGDTVEAEAEQAEAEVTEAANEVEADAEMAAENVEREMLEAPEVERDGYTTVQVDDMTTEDLTGARVYGTNDEDVGEIGELLLTDNGKMDRAVIDVGGFLGLGEKSVAVTFDELQIKRSDDGEVRVYIDSTQERLEQQPTYEG
ncbi:MAG: PRC-barrel domain-containing protein [Pseudomonadota bacterium]